MRWVYMREGVPFSLADQVKLVLDAPYEGLYIDPAPVEEEGELRRLLKQVQPGDTSVVASLLVFGKSVSDLRVLLERLDAQQVSIESWSYPASPYTPAFFRTQRRQKRQRKRMRASQEEGLTQKQIDRIRSLYVEEQFSVPELAWWCHVSEETIHQLVLTEAKREEGPNGNHEYT